MHIRFANLILLDFSMHSALQICQINLWISSLCLDLILAKDIAMVNYALHYFNGRGRAEISRMIFAYAGVQYKDDRIEDWPNTKKGNAIFRKQLSSVS